MRKLVALTLLAVLPSALASNTCYVFRGDTLLGKKPCEVEVISDGPFTHTYKRTTTMVWKTREGNLVKDKVVQVTPHPTMEIFMLGGEYAHEVFRDIKTLKRIDWPQPASAFVMCYESAYQQVCHDSWRNN